MADKIKKVLANMPQNLSDEEKRTARENIGAGIDRSKDLDSLKMWSYSTSVRDASIQTTDNEWFRLTNYAIDPPSLSNQRICKGMYFVVPKLAWKQTYYPESGTADFALKIVPESGISVSNIQGLNTVQIDGEIAVVVGTSVDMSRKVALMPTFRMNVDNVNYDSAGRLNFYWYFKINGTLPSNISTDAGLWSGVESHCWPWVDKPEDVDSRFQTVYMERI